MKLASLRKGRDGALIVVSRNLKTASSAAPVAATMQEALDRWNEVEPALRALYEQLNADTAKDAFEFDIDNVAGPLRRSYQFRDGAADARHIPRPRRARREQVPADFYEKPLVYQGISHGFMAWNETVPLPPDELGIAVAAEIFA